MYKTQGRKDSYGEKVGGCAEEKTIRRTLTQEGKTVCEISGPLPLCRSQAALARAHPGSCCAGSFHFLFVNVRWGDLGVGAGESYSGRPSSPICRWTDYIYGLKECCSWLSQFWGCPMRSVGARVWCAYQAKLGPQWGCRNRVSCLPLYWATLSAFICLWPMPHTS